MNDLTKLLIWAKQQKRGSCCVVIASSKTAKRLHSQFLDYYRSKCESLHASTIEGLRDVPKCGQSIQYRDYLLFWPQGTIVRIILHDGPKRIAN